MTDYLPPPDRGLELLYQDEQLLVINKPSGLLSVPGRGEDKADCLSARVQVRFSDALVVHRLDMSTSGIIVMARGMEAQRKLSRSFELRETEKRYQAQVAGLLAGAGEVNLPMMTDWPNRPRQKVDQDQGKPALTYWRSLSYDPQGDCTLVELMPVTGRSHQLRVHMLALGHPILGDDLYAPMQILAKATRLMLHACYLAIPHPASAERLIFECPWDPNICNQPKTSL